MRSAIYFVIFLLVWRVNSLNSPDIMEDEVSGSACDEEVQAYTFHKIYEPRLKMELIFLLSLSIAILVSYAIVQIILWVKEQVSESGYFRKIRDIILFQLARIIPRGIFSKEFDPPIEILVKC